MKKKKKRMSALPTKKRLKGRIFVVGLSMCGILLLLSFEVARITLVKHEDYTKGALANMTQSEKSIEAPRGTIEDRNGKQMAVSLLTYNIILSPYQMMKNVEQEKRLKGYEVLANVVGKTATEVQAIVEERPTSQYYLLAQKIDLEEEQVEALNLLGGVTVEKTYKRSYPNGELAAQVIGFYNKNEQGQYGVEEGYDDYLVGQAGRAYSQVQESKIVTREYQEPKAGATVKLTIDKVVQEYVETTMKKYINQYNPTSASCIIMEPNTGEILAMFSYPSFDPNTYNDLSKQLGNTWVNMKQEDQTKALYSAWKNYAIQYNYEPGSTFKPLLVAMALQENVISASDTYTCSGYKKVADRVIPCWKDSGHGHQTLSDALANSCNVAMMEIAEKLDASMYTKYFSEYGFGEKTGIELAGEEAGIIHTTYSVVDKATSSIGQTFMVTPIQLITAFSSVINGGYLMEPHVVSEITSESGATLLEHGSVTRRQVLSSSVADCVRSDLKKVVDEGTGTSASISGYSIGGKTGTGQKFVEGTNHRVENLYAVSFMGFAPVDDPKVVALIVFDDLPEHTGAPASAFKDMMTDIFPYLGIETNKDEITEEEGIVSVPDLSGKDLYGAIDTLKAQGFNYDVLGSGVKVSDQYPQAGSDWSKTGTVVIYTETETPGDLVEVPELLGKTIEEAKTLVGSNFTLEGSGSGTIKTQVPSAGYKIEKNHKIIVQTSE